VPDWLKHPNSVDGICGVNIVAHEKHHAALKTQFGGLYQDLEGVTGGFQCQTANGILRVMTADAFESDIGPLTDEIRQEDTPSIAGMDFTAGDLSILLHHLTKSEIGHRAIENGVILTNQSLIANTIIRFFGRH
jgi:hypothetical protein